MEEKAKDKFLGENMDITKSLEAARLELRTLMNSIPGGVCRLVYDGGLLLEYANEGMFNLMKVTAKEFAERYDNRYDKLLAEDEWKELQKKIESGRDGGVIQMEYAVHYMDGRKEWRLMQAVLLISGGKTVLQSVITDITDVKKTYFQLEQEKKKLDVLASISGDMIFEYDIEKDAMVYTRQGEDVINDEQTANAYTRTIRQSGYVHPEDADRLEQFCNELHAGKKHILTELRKKYRDGKYHWVEIEGVTLCDYAGKPVKVMGHTKNIDERKEKEEQLKSSLEKDSLTGVY
ncbi:MAG: PAS domain-containing protein, partial [Lachnospiraceae bacterium]|nr:PAS domain-containing protein [Lachnospiraceae bacterium]